MRRLLLCALLLTGFALAAACAGNGDGESGEPKLTPIAAGEITPAPGNSELDVGENRFALGLINPDNTLIIPDAQTSLRLRFFFLNDLIVENETEFVFAVPGEKGFFVTNVNFPAAGEWQVEPVLVTADATTVLRRLTFTVREESAFPNVGQPAVPVENLTLGQEPNIKRLSTDEQPDQAFYQKTVAQSLQEGRPVVIVFATPAFCQTRFCGPILDNVKTVRPDFADQVDFIHIEPFELDADGQLVEGDDGFPVASAPMQAWGLQTEPWIFVVNAEGRIGARFEGSASPDELREAIQAALA